MDMIKNKYAVNKGSINDLHPFERSMSADANPLSEILERAEHQYHFRGEEVALTHPVGNGTIKIRNTGSVDMFGDQDNGIRLDPNSQSVNVFSNHYKSHIHHMTEWLTGSSESYIKGDKKVKTYGETNIYSGKDIIIEGKKGLYIQIDKDEKVTIGGNSTVDIKGDSTVNVNGDADLLVIGNVNAKIMQHATIEVLKDLTVRAGCNISMVAGGHVHIDGTKLFIGMDVRH